MSDTKKMVKVTIDGREVQVEEGLPLIEAAAKLDIDIPRFCYHPHLSIAGNCRMCAVEVDKARGLPISCATPCTEGMVAKTDTDPVKRHRALVMEFLLVNHPIDCPICDQAGECWLQKYYMEHDLKNSRLSVDKVHYDKRVPIGPRVVLDQERCVECTRCIRFCDEVSKTGELRMANRGDRNAITTFPGIPLDNNYSVNTADICPVGALTQTDFRFKARVWFLKEAPTICPGCSRGCNVTVDYGWHDIVTDYNGTAYRLRPRVNDAVNKAWMCDFGREEYHPINDHRLAGAKVDGKDLRFTEAMSAAASALAGGGQQVLLLGSLRATLEEMAALLVLAKNFAGATAASIPDRRDGIEDDILLRADKHPNRRGARWLGLERELKSLPALLAGKKAVLIHDVDLLALDESGAIKAALQNIPVRVVIAANATETSNVATHLLPAHSYLEKNGHWANCDGRVQRVRKGQEIRPRPGTMDDLAILSAISGHRVASDARTVFNELAATVPELSGMTYDLISPRGLLPGEAPKEAMPV